MHRREAELAELTQRRTEFKIIPSRRISWRRFLDCLQFLCPVV